MGHQDKTDAWIASELRRIDAESAVGSNASKSYLFPEYREDLLGFVANVLGNVTHDPDFDHKAAMWRGQRAIFSAVERYKYVNVYSSRGTGKDHALARLILAVFYTRPCRILCLAPSMRQLQSILFSEISKCFYGSKHKLTGDLLSMKLKLSGDAKHYILGIPAGDPDRARGFHPGAESPGDPDRDELTEDDLVAIEEMLSRGEDETDEIWVIVDEPEGIKDEVFRVLDGTMSKRRSHMACIGNPAQGLFDEHTYPSALRSADKDVWRINLSSIPHGDFPGENLEQLSMFDEVYDNPPRWLIPQEARDKAKRVHDSQDPVFLSDWRGLFSEDTLGFQVIPYTALRLAGELHGENKRRLRLGPRIGVDLGFGSDLSVATLLVDGVVRDLVAWRDSRDDKTLQVTVARRIVTLSQDWGASVYENWPESWDGGAIVGGRLSIDMTGLAGVADIMSSMGVECDRVNFSAKYSGDPTGLVDGQYEMLNERAGMYWHARMGLQDGMYFVPFTEKYAELRRQLPWTLYEREDYKIRLESKVSTIKEHGNSPDYADSFVLACKPTQDRDGFWSTGGPILTAGRDLPTRELYRGGKKRKDRRQWTRLP